jgi:hypothetical protein
MVTVRRRVWMGISNGMADDLVWSWTLVDAQSHEAAHAAGAIRRPAR